MKIPSFWQSNTDDSEESLNFIYYIAACIITSPILYYGFQAALKERLDAIDTDTPLKNDKCKKAFTGSMALIKVLSPSVSIYSLTKAAPDYVRASISILVLAPSAALFYYFGNPVDHRYARICQRRGVRSSVTPTLGSKLALINHLTPLFLTIGLPIFLYPI